MPALHLSLDDARRLIDGPDLDRVIGVGWNVPLVVVDVGNKSADDAARALTGLPVVAIAVGAGGRAWDVVTDDPAAVEAGVLANPQASVVATQVLRSAEGMGAIDAFAVESLAYGTLQAGTEHAAWLAERGRRVRPADDRPRVRVDDMGDRVTLTLDRPRLRNLVDAAMRDELTEALRALAADGTDRPIELRGAGPVFCAGGDPGEFGTVADPATGHVIRSTANVGPWLARLASRLTAHVHGAAVGAGIELAAMCGRVVAAPETSFRLPEVSMGLIPGAGGTWSISRRVGRQRALAWMLTGAAIDAETARAWGLVDAID